MITEQSDIWNFADDNLILTQKRLTEIGENVVSDTQKSILNWLRINSSKAYPRKFQFMILGDKLCHKHVLKINSIKVKDSDDALLQGITIDKNLTFKHNVKDVFRKAQYKLHSLRCIRKFLTMEIGKIFGNAFTDCQFSFALLLWMLCRETLYSKIEKVHRKTFKVIYESNDTKFSNLPLVH